MHSLQIFRDLGVPYCCAEVLGNLSVANMRAGDFHQAITFAEQSLAIFQKLGNDADAGNQHINIAETYIEWGKLDEAFPELRSARRAFGEKPNRYYLTYYFEAAFKLAVELHAYESAAAIYGYAERYRRGSRSPLQPSERGTIESRRAVLERALGTPAFDRLRRDGAAMEMAIVEGLIERLGSAPKQSSSVG